jgi:hypothetical protein
MDAEGNNVTSSSNALVIARSATHPHAVYNLSRSTFGTSSVSGVIKWCDVYSGKQQNDLVVVGANIYGNIVYWNSSFINVRNYGPPTIMLPNTTATTQNQTLLPGNAPPKVTFLFQDAGRNPVNDLAGVAVRVRIVPKGSAMIGRSAASILMASRKSGRRLLQSNVSSATSCNSATSTELPLEFVFTFKSSDSQNSVGPEFLCRAGTNDVYYDIGTIDGGIFTTTYPSAFEMSVEVLPGAFQSFMFIPYPNASAVQTFTLIDFLEVAFLDLGLNVVSGNVTMSLMCTNLNLLLYPARPFTVISNSTLNAILPPFFVYVLDWTPSTAPFVAEITASNISIPQYGPGIAAFRLNQTCSPGYQVVKLSFDSLLRHSPKTNVTNPTVTCARCANGTVSSQFDSWTCRSAA